MVNLFRAQDHCPTAGDNYDDNNEGADADEGGDDGDDDC